MRGVALLLGVILLTAALASGAHYTGVDLHPAAGFGETHAYVLNDGQQVGWGTCIADGNARHALLWSGSAASFIDLHPQWPPGHLTNSVARGASQGRQVGWVESAYGGTGAVLWFGSADSIRYLGPSSGYASSRAYGTDGPYQVGSAVKEGAYRDHAIMWAGIASSYVDLHPTGFDSSVAVAISGNAQVGRGIPSNDRTVTHALLWYGSATNLFDLHPQGHSNSEAIGVMAGQQVGLVDNRAALWMGNKFSFVDLNPVDAWFSIARGTNGTQQVGYATGTSTGGMNHAFLWSGSAASAIDLHALLPGGTIWKDSYADSIDAAGNIVGCALDAYNTYHAVAWFVPEPASALSCFSGILLLMRRRRTKVNHALA